MAEILKFELQIEDAAVHAASLKGSKIKKQQLALKIQTLF